MRQSPRSDGYFDLLPNFGSVPLSSRLMFARCVQNTKTLSASSVVAANLVSPSKKAPMGTKAAAVSQVREDEAMSAFGVDTARDADGDVVLRSRAGERLVALPPAAARRVLQDVKMFGPQTALLRAGIRSSDPESLRERALRVFANLAERHHDFSDALILQRSAEARTDAFVSSLRSLKRAETPEARKKAENLLRATLYSEADTENRLARLALDLFTPMGNLNAAEAFGEESADAYKAIADGRHSDAGAHAFWAAIEGMSALGGSKYLRVFKELGVRTPLVRRMIRARDLARMEANAAKSMKSYSGEEMFGAKFWNQLDPYQQTYLESIARLAKGQVGEKQLSKALKAVGASSEVNANAKIADEAKKTRKRRVSVPLRGKAYTRVFDDALKDQELTRFLWFFLFPKSAPGRITQLEHKAATAGKSSKQARADEQILKDRKNFGNASIQVLRTPYDDLSKLALRRRLLDMMRNPNGAGRSYVEGGRIRRSINGESTEFTRVRWSEEDFEKMIRGVEQAMLRQAASDIKPTVMDFFAALGARIAALDTP